MTAYCKKFDKCYFPKDIAKGNFTREQMDKYICSCNFGGLDCELNELSDIEFKVFERFKE